MSSASRPIPPRLRRPAPLGWFAGIVLGMATIGAGAVVFFFNPSTHGFFPVCLFHQLTGLNCPGCGATRALYALLHGNLLLACHDNLLFMLALPTALVWSIWWIWRQWLGRPVNIRIAPKWLWLLLVVGVVFTVARNLPGFEWLSP